MKHSINKSLYPFILSFTVLITAAVFLSCEQTNIFSDKDDVELGKEFDREIKNNPREFPMLDGHQDVKDYVTDMGKTILNSPYIKKKKIYPYNFQIINDTIINAFCTPGGFVYIYTGLMRFADNEATLAGIVGHEIAHAEMRHVTQRLTAYYGVSMLLSFILGGNPSLLAEIAANLFVGLAFLKNSRDDETEADYYSIKYLPSTKWYPGGITYSFERKDKKFTIMLLAFKLTTVKNIDDFIYNMEKDISLNIPQRNGDFTEKDFGNYDMKSAVYKD